MFLGKNQRLDARTAYLASFVLSRDRVLQLAIAQQATTACKAPVLPLLRKEKTMGTLALWADTAILRALLPQVLSRALEMHVRQGTSVRLGPPIRCSALQALLHLLRAKQQRQTARHAQPGFIAHRRALRMPQFSLARLGFTAPKDRCSRC